MKEEKIVCFAGHRYDWQNIGIKENLEKIIINLIEQGYTIFYDGGKGSFDKISSGIVIRLKTKYPQIKIYRILSYYQHKKERGILPSCYDGSIYPEIENIFPKARISKRNEWIVDNSDILVCHIIETYKSGAYNTVKYAKKVCKPIISV